MKNTQNRRLVAAVIGNARPDQATGEAAEATGRLLVDAGCRVLTGGLGGVMEAACRGARSSAEYREGDTIGVLPTYDPSTANPHVDVCICTGLNHARNVIVAASADVVLVVGGRTGTLSEVALAWGLGRPIVVVAVAGAAASDDELVESWGAELAGRRLDDRREDTVVGPLPPTGAVEVAVALALAGADERAVSATRATFRDEEGR